MPRIVLKDLDTDKSRAVPDLEATLGRDPASSVVIEGPKSKVVSSRHARIFFQDNAWWIEDTSRNGTVLDDERLQAGQRHALRVGQVVGLGESGPRFRVAALESRKVAETVLELPDLDQPPAPTPPPVEAAAPAAAAPPRSVTAPRPAATPDSRKHEPEVPESTTAMRRSEAVRAGLRFEEPTEPMSPAPDWLVKITLRATNSNQHFEVTALTVKIGRSPECNVQVPPEMGASVSRLHAEIAIADGGVVVRDAGSRNGTFLNGKKLEDAHAASKGDLVMLGSGGPTFAIEDLHIVRGQEPQSPPGGERTPAEPKSSKRKGMVEPQTDPTPLPQKRSGDVKKVMGPATNLARRSFAGVGRTAFFKDVLEDMSQKSAKRVRVIVWTSVGAVVVIAGGLLALFQMRVSNSERRMAEDRRQYEARSDSIRQAASIEASRLRASFDSARSSSAPRAVLDSLRDALADAARRTGALEQSLARARESMSQYLAAGDSARRKAEQEMNRLRSEVSRASGGDGSRAVLDSLRRELKAAEDRATEVATQVRAVRGSNIAQVAQNGGAVGLLVSFVGERVVSGSGFAITPSGYFITNAHVVLDDNTGKVRDTIYVTMNEQRFGTTQRIQVVALGGKDLDIAVVKIPNYRGPYMKKVDWKAQGASQGEPAALIGFPYGVELAFDDTSTNVVRTSMSAGIFSKVAPDRIQFDGFTIGGSSGSPVFNAAGEVVAVHKAGLKEAAGLGFSIPVSRVLPLLPADARSELGIR